MIFVLATWGIAALVLALIAAGLLTVAVSARAGADKRLRRTAAWLPVKAAAWCGCVFIAQAVINEVYLDRDLGMGDSWRCPLPDGYSLTMIDVTDQGYLTPADDQTKPTIQGVHLLQVEGNHILGAAGAPTAKYFLLHTASGSLSEYATPQALAKAAERVGIKMKLDPIDAVYHRHRWTLFDLAALLVAIGPPAFASIRLYRQTQPQNRSA